MKIAFIFNANFNILSHLQQPLGGSESAVSYLAMELAKLGHEVTLFTQTSEPVTAYGVNCLSIKLNGNDISFDKAIIDNKFDALIFKNGLLSLIPQLKINLPYHPKIFFWTGHAANQPALADLDSNDIVSSIDKIIAVSRWHKNNLLQHFALPADKIIIHKNAIAPCFENLFTTESEFIAAKSKTPILAYTSTPFRGLDKLIQIFIKLKANIPKAVLNIFSSMQVYGIAKQQDKFTHLYQQAQNITGINYYGSLTQTQLANQLKAANIFAYPNTFAETSCIAVMEALACGLKVVTTNNGALAETSLGYADLIDKEQDSDFLQALVNNSTMLINGKSSKNNKDNKNNIKNKCIQFHEFLNKQYQQLQDINANCTWAKRAKKWQRSLL